MFPVQFQGAVDVVAPTQALTVDNAAELVDVTPHTLRHTAISHLVMSGMPLLDVAAFVGCSLRTISTTYAHYSTDHLRDQVEYVLRIDTQEDAQDVET